MKIIRLAIFSILLTSTMTPYLFSNCTPNPCSTPMGPTRCSPVDLPNNCDFQHWCIDRNNISITPRQDQAGNCAYWVDVDITYQLSCTGGGVGVLPYNDVFLWLTMRTAGCVDQPGDLGNYPVPHYMCNTIVAGPWLLGEVGNTSPSCTLQDTRHFSTTPFGPGPNCNNPPLQSIDISQYTWMCPDCEYFWEVDLTRGLLVLDWVGRDREPAQVCMTETPTTPPDSPSETPSHNSEPTGPSEPNTEPSEPQTETPTETEVPTETIIEPHCQEPVEPMGAASDIGREAGKFGALHDLRPVGDTFLVSNPASQLGTSAGDACPFVFIFGGGSSSQGTPQQREFHMQLPVGTSEPLLYYQFGPDDWRAVPDQQRDPDGTLRVTPDLYGYFQVFSKITTPKPNLGDVYVFPNPTKNGEVPTVHIDADKSDDVAIRIYDTAGDLVVETRVTSPIKSENGKPCYEHPLDPSRFKSGVYIGAVTLKRGGESSRKTFRFTVVK